MARTTLTLEDTTIDGDVAVAFHIEVEPTEFDRGLQPEQCPGSVAAALSIRDLWRTAVIVNHARKNLDRLLNEAMDEKQQAKKEAIFLETFAPSVEVTGAAV